MRPALGPAQQGQHRLRDREGPEEIGLHEAAGGTGCRQGRRAVLGIDDAGIVDQNIEPAMAIGDQSARPTERWSSRH